VSFSPLNVRLVLFVSAHIRGRRHKKKVASLRKEAQQSGAAETIRTSSVTDGHMDAVADDYVDDSIDEIVSD